jgi:hypothetical protein
MEEPVSSQINALHKYGKVRVISDIVHLRYSLNIKRPRHIPLEIQVLPWDRNTNMEGLNRPLRTSEPFLIITESTTAIHIFTDDVEIIETLLTGVNLYTFKICKIKKRQKQVRLLTFLTFTSNISLLDITMSLHLRDTEVVI